MTSAVSLKNVTLRFGDVTAVDQVSGEIQAGEFFALLGPSGSGKTSCLRLIAGFEKANAGDIYINGLKVNDVPPFRRDVNTVFQDYALFPHMNVEENVGYSLMIQGESASVRKTRVREILTAVELDGMQRRRTSELSGGQRQRVALARALINKPRIVLLDEPLGALDLKLREQMQEELKSLQKRLGVTFIYVTHDQQEALSMCDRVAVFNHGRVEQVGTPKQIYQFPQTPFVAGFVGSSNILGAEQSKKLFGMDSLVSIRPECIAIVKDVDGLAGTICDISYLGPVNRVTVEIDERLRLVVTEAARQNGQDRKVGERIRLSIEPEMIQPLRPD